MAYIVVAAIVVFFIILVLVIRGKRKGINVDAKITNKKQAQIIKECIRKLSKNPDNADALIALSDVYFDNNIWDKAFPLYKNQVRVAGLHPQIDLTKANLRAGICLIKQEFYEQALDYCLMAYSRDGQSKECNFYLGLAYLKAGNFEKCIPCFKKVLVVDPSAQNVDFYIGKAYYELKRYREALKFLKTSLEIDPTNREAVYLFADSLAENGNGDKSIKLFERLRTDPKYGPKACLRLGIYQLHQGNHEGAERNFVIGLKLPSASTEISTELKYRLALCYFELSKFQDGLTLLSGIAAINPNYKDVNSLIARYQELNQNSNLRIYLSGSAGEFTALVRRMTEKFYKDAIVKILDISIGSIYTDVIAEVELRGRDKANYVFRYFRTNSTTGEVYIRELHDSLHEKKNSLKGICFTAGEFSDGVHHYVDGRPIDLVEKVNLKKLLKIAN